MYWINIRRWKSVSVKLQNELFILLPVYKTTIDVKLRHRIVNLLFIYYYLYIIATSYNSKTAQSKPA